MAFAGDFDGNDHTISHLTIRGDSCLGLFGELAGEAPMRAPARQVEVSRLRLVAVDVNGVGNLIGALAGSNYGSISAIYSSGLVHGNDLVGGLVGRNGTYDQVVGAWGRLTSCSSSAAVFGDWWLGRLQPGRSPSSLRGILLQRLHAI